MIPTGVEIAISPLSFLITVAPLTRNFTLLISAPGFKIILYLKGEFCCSVKTNSMSTFG